MPNPKHCKVHDCVCPVHNVQMNLKLSKYGWFYSCPEWPKCNITHGCHQHGTNTPGKPMGVPADKATRTLRHDLHLAFDGLWMGGNGFHGDRKTRRQTAYAWLQQRMGISKEQCHIGMFTAAQCQQAMNICRKELG